jgi:hypothetical protein
MNARTVRHTRVLLATLALAVAGVSQAFAQKVPRPEDALGFKPGADFKLATYEQAVAYFRQLEQASPLIKVFDLGKTSMGKPMIYAVITSQANMARLDRYKEITRRLSLVTGVGADEAPALAAEGRAVVYIDGGLHANECAPAQHLIQLAYDLVTGDDATTRLVRDNVIAILVFANPDGMDLLADWYQSNLGTPYEVGPMPWLYHKYSGHDNNRDSYMVNLVETRNITRLVDQEWYPEILYNQHQTGPFPTRIFVPPQAEPTNPNIHPLVLRWQNLIGTAMAAAFEQENKPGVVSGFRYDSWYPGYETQAVDGHNIISILTETNLYRFATPHFYTVADFPEPYRDVLLSVFYPNPWKGGWWRLGDAVAYNLTASKAVLRTAAVYREQLLLDKYRVGAGVVARFQKEPPYAWILPRDQRDPPTAALLLNNLKLLGIEIAQSDASFTADGLTYPAGTWVIPMSQPFGLFVKNLMEEQVYPDLTKYPDAWQGLVSPQRFKDAYLPPYDIAGWTLPYQMGVTARAANTPLTVPLTPIERATVEGRVAGAVGGAGAAYLIPPQTNNSFIAVNRILKEGGEVSRAREAFTSGSASYPPGTFIVTRGMTPAAAGGLAKDLGLVLTATTARPPASAARLRAPRVALYRSWTAQMDEGWARFLFDQFEFAFTNVQDPEVRAGHLERNFDVLVIPSMSTDAIVDGLKIGTVPPQYAGGITAEGVRNIKSFVESGGTLVLLNRATLFAIDRLQVPVTNVLKEFTAPSRREGGEATAVEFACPGSVLRMEFDPKHPVAFGMPEKAPGMFIDSPAFRINPAFGDKAPVTIAKYPADDLLMSGYLKGEKYLQNTVAAADVSLGKGRVILLGFSVEQRGQPHGTFKLLFNSLYYATMGAGVPAATQRVK